MNIVYLIGNGFDLNLELKTSYKSFYDNYCLGKSKSDNIEKLKKAINKDIQNWSDLELALGKYTSKVNTPEEFEEIRSDIVSNLSKYLKSQQELLDVNKIDVNKLTIDLSSPQRSLPRADEILIDEFLKPIQHEISQIDIITFNYTDILEKLITDKLNLSISYTNAINRNTIIRSIEHIHGTLDERMIIGVNDYTQVENINFNEDLNFIESFIKSEYNKSAKHMIDVKCTDLISKANIICIYGSSIGESDNLWWQLIGEKLKESNCKLIIFEKCFDITNKLNANLISKKRREVIQKFISRTSFGKEEKQLIQGNIFVEINSEFFKIVN